MVIELDSGKEYRQGKETASFLLGQLEESLFTPFSQKTGLDNLLHALRQGAENDLASVYILEPDIFPRGTYCAKLQELFEAVANNRYFQKFLITLGINREESRWNSFQEKGIYSKTMDDYGIVHDFSLRPGAALRSGNKIFREFDYTLEEVQTIIGKIITHHNWLLAHLLYSRIDAIVQEKFEFSYETGRGRPGLLKTADANGLITGVELHPELNIKKFEDQPSREESNDKAYRNQLVPLYCEFLFSPLVDNSRDVGKSGIEKWLEKQEK